MKQFDEDLVFIKQIIAGDVDLFERLVEKYKQTVASIVAGRVPYKDMEEVCHDIFLRAYNSLGRYSAKSPFSHWLSRLAVRGCCDYWRSRKRSREVAVSTLTDDQKNLIDVLGREQSEDNFSREEAQSDAGELLEQCMVDLTPEDRMLMELVYWKGWKLKDVAESFGWGLSRTKIRAMRVRQRLRKKIELLELEERGGSYE